MRRRFTLDIEINWNRIEDPNFDMVIAKGSSPIQMIGCYDSFKNKFYSFFYHNNVKISKNDEKIYLVLSRFFNTKNFNVKEGKFNSSESKISWDCRYFSFNNERVMLTCFMKFIKDIIPDIWHGFFIETFDLVYIINRCKFLNILYSYLSPLLEVYISHGRAKIRGSIIYDIPKLYAHYMGSHRHANSLKKISESHLKRDDKHKITKTSESIINEDWYENNWDKFIEYCLVDVELCVLLEKELGLIDIAERFEKFTGVNPEFVTYPSHIIESIFSYIKVLYEKEILQNKYKIAFATKKKGKMERAAGAIVLPSKKGFYKLGIIIIFDLSKMYPEIIRSLNISIETFSDAINESIKHLYNYCKENNVYYLKEPKGFVPFAFEFLFKIRKQIEDIRDQYEYGSQKYVDMNKQRQTVKDTVNAVSGQFDYEDSIIVKPECANSTRLTGQKEILTARDFVRLFSEKTNIRTEVLYGDTDSIFILVKDINEPEIGLMFAKEITKWIQHGFDLYAKELNLDKHYFSIGLEKILDVFVSIGKKKKYFGHVVWADGHFVKEETSLLVKGFETRRSDSSDLTDKAQKEIFNLINQTRIKGWDNVRKEIINKIRNEYPKEINDDNVLTIGIPKGLTKPFHLYKVTNPHLEGCKYAKKYLNAQFGAGSKPKLLYIKEVKENKLGLPQTNVLCVEEGMKIPEGVFIIDKNKMIEKTIFDKLDDTLEVVGIDKTEVLDGLRKMNIKDFAKKYNNLKKTAEQEHFFINNNNYKQYLEKAQKMYEKMINDEKNKSK